MNNKIKLIKIIIISIICSTLFFSLFNHKHWTGIREEKDKTITDKIFSRLYFTMTTFSTTGYGDIYPTSNILKSFVMIIQFSITVSLIDIFL